MKLTISKEANINYLAKIVSIKRGYCLKKRS